MPKRLLSLASLLAAVPLAAQQPLPDARVHEIVASVSAERIARDVRTLVGFGTRHSLSDTVSATRGIGAARRWIAAEFERISAACGGCLEVRYVAEIWGPVGRIPEPTQVVNVIAFQRGESDPHRMVAMSGDIDARVSDTLNAADSIPGANDNASGMAGVLEAARVLTRYRFPATIAYLGLSGEEQGLFGGQTVARLAADSGWNLEAVLNNDMIGNIEGVDGVIENTTARVFSDGMPPIEVALERLAGMTYDEMTDTGATLAIPAGPYRRLLGAVRNLRRRGGDVDGPSRQLARYVDRIADLYLPTLDVLMIYRLDRFRRGGHHRPFADRGFPAVRIMETHENYKRQHQDIRVEDGIAYGDVIEGVDFAYAAKLTALNTATLSSLAWAPGTPRDVRLTGAVLPAATLRWTAPRDTANLAGYRVYWRRTDSSTWDFSRWVGGVTSFTFEGLVVDNYFFGVAAVAPDGNESTVAFPR